MTAALRSLPLSAAMVISLLPAWAGVVLADARVRQERMAVTLHDPAFARPGEDEVVTLENDRIVVRVAPGMGGNIIAFADRTREASPFSRLDDRFGSTGRWEPGPFTVRIDDRGPDRAAVTLTTVGTLTPAPGGEDQAAAPTTIALERTMSIDGESSRLRVQVKFTNTGQTTVPMLRYMVHSLYSYKVLPGHTVYAFLPTPRGVELFDHDRIAKAQARAQVVEAGHPFTRWSRPGETLYKGRHEARGWIAMVSDTGHSYLYYPADEYDFVSLWNGTHPAEWLTLEPNTRAVDLKPGESTAFRFTLAADSRDVPFAGETMICDPISVPDRVAAGGTIEVSYRAATVRDVPEQAEVVFTLSSEADGEGAMLKQRRTLDLRPFFPADFAEQVNLPDAITPGRYPWAVRTASGRTLAEGVLKVVAADTAAPPDAEAPDLGDSSDGSAQAFPPATWSNGIGMTFMRIPAGEFIMGSDDPRADPDEKPAHRVRITRTFLMAKYLVTNEQFRRFRPNHKALANRSHTVKATQVGLDRQPVLTPHNTVWAREFIAYLNETDDTRPDGWEYRLPTEAEWEYAARGPESLSYPWGNAWDSNRCDFADQRLAMANDPGGQPGPEPVGSHSPAGDSPFGVSDLAGGAWEWCEDFYDPTFYRRSPVDDPVCILPTEGDNLQGEGSEVRRHVQRGGSWGSLPGSCRSSFRFVYGGTHAPTMGIRVVLAPVRPPAEEGE